MEEAWNFFEDILPPEVAELIFSCLSLEDVVYVSIVCKAWNTYFDAKDIWKKISEHYYGQLSEKAVDLTQNFRWKRIFICLKKAHQWSKSFPQTATSYMVPDRFNRISTPQMNPNGNYIYTLTTSVEIKMAAKLVQQKRDPLTTDDRRWVLNVPGNVQPDQYKVLSSDGSGKYLLCGYSNNFFLCDSAQMASPVTEQKVTQLVFKSDQHITIKAYRQPTIGSFNSRFVVLASDYRLYISTDIEHVIYDLKSVCSHSRPFFKDKQKNQYHMSLYGVKINCQETLVKTPFGALGVFASQLVPEKIVFILRVPDEKKSVGQYVLYPKLAIWTPTGGLNEKDGIEFKHDAESPVKYFNEQVVDGHHWLCFDMGPHTRIVDLNDLRIQFRLNIVRVKLWIPRKNMILLASGKKITVFDVSQNRWTSRMACPNDVCAMILNKSERILFVADTKLIHAFHWETAKLIGSVPHPLAQAAQVVETLHIAFDQVLILNSQFFLKMPHKCDA